MLAQVSAARCPCVPPTFQFASAGAIAAVFAAPFTGSSRFRRVSQEEDPSFQVTGLIGNEVV